MQQWELFWNCDKTKYKIYSLARMYVSLHELSPKIWDLLILLKSVLLIHCLCFYHLHAGVSFSFVWSSGWLLRLLWLWGSFSHLCFLSHHAPCSHHSVSAESHPGMTTQAPSQSFSLLLPPFFHCTRFLFGPSCVLLIAQPLVLALFFCTWMGSDLPSWANELNKPCWAAFSPTGRCSGSC